MLPTSSDVFSALGVIIACIAGLIALVTLYRNYLKDQRSLKLTLVQVPFYEVYQIQLANPGFRPITVMGVALNILSKDGSWLESVPEGSQWGTFDDIGEPKFPLVLTDGQSRILPLSGPVIDMLHEDYHLAIAVFDSEGNVYKKYNRGEYNPKWGYRVEFRDPNFIQKILMKIVVWIASKQRTRDM